MTRMICESVGVLFLQKIVIVLFVLMGVGVMVTRQVEST